MEQMDSMEFKSQYKKYLDLLNFILKYLPEYSEIKDEIIDFLIEHELYDTLDYGFDDKGITYVIRYNITPSGKICDVLDLAIREDKRNKDFLKWVIARNNKKWPQLRFFRFSRGTKYPNREDRIYEIEQVLRRRK